VVKDSSFRPIFNRQLIFAESVVRAQVVLSGPRVEPSEADIFEKIFCGWVREAVLPHVTVNLEKIRAEKQGPAKYRYSPINEVALVKFFLEHFLLCLKDSTTCNENLEEIKLNTTGIQRRKALNNALNFGNETLRVILNNATSHMLKAITPGTVSTVDEAVWSYFSRIANKEEKLRFLKNKPHDFGLLCYLHSQPLHYSELPVVLAFEAVFLDDPPTPIIALNRLRATLLRAGAQLSADHITVTDSLWSYPAHFNQYLNLGQKVVVSVKENSGTIPIELLNLASRDLPIGNSRTYYDGKLVLQVVQTADHVTSVLTTAARVRGEAELSLCRLLTYASAKALFENETPASLIKAYDKHFAHLRLVLNGHVVFRSIIDLTSPRSCSLSLKSKLYS